MDEGLGLRVTDLQVTGAGRVLISVPRFEMPAGGALGVRGPSGAGKSTFLFALAGLVERARGSVTWGDHDMISLPPGRRAAFRARHMGIVFQDFLLFEELDAARNADLSALFRPKGERAGLRQRAEDLLGALGLGKAEQRRVSTLSGGERQRVAVARALAGGGAILLADEPTANLDRAAADRLIDDLVARVRRDGTTLVTISHDERLLDRMDRVIAIQDGRLEAA